jgi:hypothetical protein
MIRTIFLAAGLAVVFAEDPQGKRALGLTCIHSYSCPGIQEGPKSVHPNKQWERLCEIYNKLSAELR